MDTESITTPGEASEVEAETVDNRKQQAAQLFGEVEILLREALSSSSIRSGDPNLEARGVHPSVVLSCAKYDR